MIRSVENWELWNEISSLYSKGGYTGGNLVNVYDGITFSSFFFSLSLSFLIEKEYRRNILRRMGGGTLIRGKGEGRLLEPRSR